MDAPLSHGSPAYGTESSTAVPRIRQAPEPPAHGAESYQSGPVPLPPGVGGGTIDVSVVLPVNNEATHVHAELNRIIIALRASPYTWEVVVRG